MWEAKQYRLRRVVVPMLEAGDESLRILHITDLHITPRQTDKVAWVRELAALNPDLVVSTGDNLAHLDAVPTALEAYEPLMAFPGVFVMGSNDYYGPIVKNPLRYFRPQSTVKILGAPLPWRGLRDGFVSAGWTDLNNQRTTMKVGDRTIEFVGTDDAHLGFDEYDDVQGVASRDADLNIGVTHAPYLRVIDRMSADAFPLILAGHTHGGQICVPGLGALVVNCDLPTTKAKGLHRHEQSWLHVSAGLGTSPYAPIRFACPPEATLLTLVPAA
jgi:predicted MPP superfamily phosphohydrolase